MSKAELVRALAGVDYDIACEEARILVGHLQGALEVNTAFGDDIQAGCQANLAVEADRWVHHGTILE